MLSSGSGMPRRCCRSSRRMRRRAKVGRARAGSGTGGAMVIRPRRRSRGPAARTVRTTSSSCSGGTPVWPAMPVSSASTSTSSGGISSGRRLLSASATRPPSTEWTTSKRLAARLALLVCRWPMRCQRRGGGPAIAASVSALTAASWTRFSPRSRTPRAIISATRAGSTVLLAATSSTAPGSRPERSAAAAMRRRTAASRSASGVLMPCALVATSAESTRPPAATSASAAQPSRCWA